MKVAINCSFFIPKGGGIKEYIYNLINHLALLESSNEYILYVAKDQVDYARSNFPSKMNVKETPFNSNEPFRRSLFERKFFLKEEKLEKFDVFHSPFFHVPKLKKAKKIITVHDLRLYRYPKTYTFFRLHYLRYVVSKSIKEADHIIAISDFTKKEILSFFSIPSSKITTIHEAVNPASFNCDLIKSYQPSQAVLMDCPFLLSVGHLEPRKNYEKLIKAFVRLKQHPLYTHLKLVIVGQESFGYKSTISLINQNSDIIYLNFVEREMLLWLYKNAKLFVLTSLYEGFGFPPLEAAMLNTVSVVSNGSSIPEVCGSSAFYFDPTSETSIVDSILLALESPQEMENKRQLLKDNLNRFSWHKNAQSTLAIYNKVANNNKVTK